MLTSPESNIKLTDLETAQLEEHKTRLLNLESEISIATKNIKTIKAETETATKARVYEEGLLRDAREKIVTANAELEKTLSDLTEAKKNLNSVREMSEQIGRDNDTRKSELSDRESELKKREGSHAIRVEEFTSQSDELSKEKEKMDGSKKILSEALAKL